MGALTVTYDRLKRVAARAAGYDLAALEGDDLEDLNAVPNEAVEEVAQARRWPRLVKALSLATVAAQTYVYLPTDFQEIPLGDDLNFSSGTGYPPLQRSDLSTIYALRAGGTQTGPPELYALGPTLDDGSGNDGRLKLEFWPTPDAIYTLVGTYRRSVRAMSTGGSAPDLPTELYKAVMVATRKCAKEAFNQTVPADLLAEYERLLQRAWDVLRDPLGPFAGTLCDVTPRRRGAARGNNMALDANYETDHFYS